MKYSEYDKAVQIISKKMEELTDQSAIDVWDVVSDFWADFEDEICRKLVDDLD